MTLVYVFPGQGSQRKGMGEGLFEKFADLTDRADEQLGYSIKELCLSNPDGLLNQTQYTQPALYSVNALSYLDARQARGVSKPDYFAGHSLGEYNALFAAGTFDFLTGLKLVQERGRLMATAPKGAMAAVMGLDIANIQTLLKENNYAGVDIANYNSRHQIIISGLHDDINNCESVFVNAGARYIRLNVSAAFHSRYMQPIRAEFAKFLDKFDLRPLEIEVISNVSARPYSRSHYKDLLVQQLTQPVKWYETVSWLLTKPEPEIMEIGPSNVLTQLTVNIKKEPLLIDHSSDANDSGSAKFFPKVTSTIGSTSEDRKILFMYGGQGSQYYRMGMELYEKNSFFKENMDKCDAILKPLLQASLVEALYQCNAPLDEFDDVLYTHPALYCFGYVLTQVLMEEGIQPSAVLGYSLGEYVAATVAGIIDLEDGLRMVVEQSRYLSEKAAGGGMLTILKGVQHYEENPSLYSDVALASVNYHNNFVVSGEMQSLHVLKQYLDEQLIISLLLPVQHGFHSQAIDPIEKEFKAFVSELSTNDASIPCYSCASGSRLKTIDRQYWWDVIRRPVHFSSLVSEVHSQFPYTYVDLSPTGTLSSFLKHGFSNRLNHYVTVNQFGKNLQTVSRLVEALA